MTTSKPDAFRAPLDQRARNEKAAALMASFAERTGLSSQRSVRRYLWTDAFAVCNFLGLFRATGEARYDGLAQELIDQVHHTLGQRRAAEGQRGWLSGLAGEEAEEHPTRGGLRIGKRLPERKPGESVDEALEWDRDGQYFHYLTKWMHALDQASRSTGRAELNRWARELAETAHRAFVYLGAGGARQRMYWKMSVDLSRPLVGSTGQHDALDGYLTCAQLRVTASRLPATPGGSGLEEEARSFASMIDEDGLATTDPLGLGGLLVDADRVDQLARQGALPAGGLRDALMRAALVGLEQYVAHGELRRPAGQRLAFRELGLAIGLHAADSMRKRLEDDRRTPGSRDARELVEKLARYDSLRDQILVFWLEAAHQTNSSRLEHRDIDEVMLATALAPEGFLDLGDFSAAGCPARDPTRRGRRSRRP